MNSKNTNRSGNPRCVIKRNKAHYYNEGMKYARFTRIAAFGHPRSWQRACFHAGYRAGRIYLQAEALLYGYSDVNQYQEQLLRDMLDQPQVA